MYQIGDVAFYNAYGICTITGIEDREFNGEAQPYYVLHSTHYPTLTLYHPINTDNPQLKKMLSKTEATQRAQKAQNELELAKANAEIMLTQARAEKEANELKTRGLTPQVLEQMWIEKWNGVLPQYGTVPTLFKDITK